MLSFYINENGIIISFFLFWKGCVGFWSFIVILKISYSLRFSIYYVCRNRYFIIFDYILFDYLINCNFFYVVVIVFINFKLD